MYEKHLILKINNETIEVVDWDITIDKLEALRQDLATSRHVNVCDIDIQTIDVYVPEKSTTISVGDKGLMYKAPNQYSSWVPKDGLNFSYEIEMRRYRNGIEELTDNGLNILLEKIAKKCADDVIVFS